MSDPAVAVSLDDYLWFFDEAFDQMVAIVEELGDEHANRVPDLPGANSPYVILTHVLGVLEFWGGSQVAGREIDRDRDAEFVATGDVGPLLARAATARQQLAADLAGVDPAAVPERTLPDPDDWDLPIAKTKGAVILHIYEEVAQHLGQLQLTRDVLQGDRR